MLDHLHECSYLSAMTANIAAWAVSSVLMALMSQSSAAVIITGDVKNPSSTCTLTITDDMVFYITGSSSGVSVILDEWVTQGDLIFDSSVMSPQIAFEKNGIAGLTTASIGDNSNRNYADTTVKDGWLTLGGVSVVTGDVLTIKAGSYTFPGHLGFNNQIVPIFMGSAFVINPLTQFSISNTIVIPESSTFFFSFVGFIGLLRRRR